MLTIELDKLRTVTNKFFDELELMRGDTITLTKLDYWEVLLGDSNDRAETPPKLGFGDLAHDWEVLQNILREDSFPEVFLMYLAPILRAIGEPDNMLR